MNMFENILKENLCRMVDEEIERRFHIATRMTYCEYGDGVVELVDAHDAFLKEWQKSIQNMFFCLEGGLVCKVGFGEDRLTIEVVFTYWGIDEEQDDAREMVIATFDVEPKWCLK